MPTRSIMVAVEQIIVAIAEVLGTSTADLRCLLRAALLMLFQLFGAAEPSNVANLHFLTGLDSGSRSEGGTGS